MKKGIVILGCGGHARVLIESLKRCGNQILGCVDKTESAEANDRVLAGIPFLGSEQILTTMNKKEILLVNGLGSTANTEARKNLYLKWKQQGFMFHTVIDPRSCLSQTAVVGEGAQIAAGAVIQSGAVIGANAIVNTSAIVDHDTIVQDHCHIAPGAVISGGVEIHEGVHVGAGATIIQKIRVAARATIGAGCVVIKDVPGGAVIVGNPGRIVRVRGEDA